MQCGKSRVYHGTLTHRRSCLATLLSGITRMRLPGEFLSVNSVFWSCRLNTCSFPLFSALSHALWLLCLRFAAAGFTEGRSKAKSNGKIEFASQDVTTVTCLSCRNSQQCFCNISTSDSRNYIDTLLQVSKGSSERSFKVSVAGRKAREFEVWVSYRTFNPPLTPLRFSCWPNPRTSSSQKNWSFFCTVSIADMCSLCVSSHLPLFRRFIL